MLVALGVALLAACGPIPLDEQHRPDVMDNIRNQDLLPRFPQGSGQNGQNSATNGKVPNLHR